MGVAGGRLEGAHGRRAGHAGRAGSGAHGRLQVRNVVLLFPLHPAVLEPDFDLSLAEVEHVRDLDAPPARQVAVEVELFLELQRLVSRVRSPGTLAVGTVALRCKPTRTHTARTSTGVKKLKVAHTRLPSVGFRS